MENLPKKLHLYVVYSSDGLCAQFFYEILEFVKVWKSAKKLHVYVSSSVHVSPLINVGCNHKGPKCIVHHWPDTSSCGIHDQMEINVTWVE